MGVTNLDFFKGFGRGDKFKAYFDDGKKEAIFTVEAIDDRGFIDVEPFVIGKVVILAIPFSDIISIERG